MQLEDGFGSGMRLQITADGMAAVQAVTIDSIHAASHNGTAFSVLREATSYTSAAGQSGVIYIKNTGTQDVHIDSLFFSLTAAARVKVIRNPTTGTLVTAGTVFSPVNLNFSSGNTFAGDCLLGTSGQTVTNGTTAISRRYPAGVYFGDLRSAITIERGGSIAITITPEADCVADVSLWVYSVSVS